MSQQEQMVRERLSETTTKFLNQPLPKVAWLVKDGILTMVHTRNHRRVKWIKPIPARDYYPH